MYPIAVRITGSTVVDGAGPAGKSRRVRFAAKKVQILLTNEKVRVVYRICAGREVVVEDGDGRGR